MNSAAPLRVLTVAGSTLLLLTVTAFAGAVASYVAAIAVAASGTVKLLVALLALGNLLGVAGIGFGLWFAVRWMSARLARLVTYWQADVAAVENNEPRPEVGDLLVSPRVAAETAPGAARDDERARRG